MRYLRDGKRMNGDGDGSLVFHLKHRKAFIYLFLNGRKEKTNVQALSMSLIPFWFQLAKKLHPDTNKDDKEAEQKFQEVNRAYEVHIILSM